VEVEEGIVFHHHRLGGDGGISYGYEVFFRVVQDVIGVQLR